MTTQTWLNGTGLVAELKRNGVTHVVFLPDSETRFLYDALVAEPSLKLVPVCREGESMAIAAGLIIGGKKPVVLMQNSGFFESGDSIRGICLELHLPLVMLIGYRGWTRHGVTTDSRARYTEPNLLSWGIEYYVVDCEAHLSRVSSAFEEASRRQVPVAVLIAKEYE